MLLVQQIAFDKVQLFSGIIFKLQEFRWEPSGNPLREMLRVVDEVCVEQKIRGWSDTRFKCISFSHTCIQAFFM